MWLGGKRCTPVGLPCWFVLVRGQVGMHPADVALSNLRMGLVQVTSYGHSSSTHGSEIDYFIGAS